MVRSSGDTVDGITITDNKLRVGTIASPADGGPPLQVDVAGYSRSTRIANVVIARNTIDIVHAGADGGIFIGAGLQRARKNAIEDVRIVDNMIRMSRPKTASLCCFGVVASAGTDYFAFPAAIEGSPDSNVLRRVEVSGNEISGPLASGIRIQAGVDGGGSANRVESVRVTGNSVTSTIVGRGIYLWIGQAGGSRMVSGNSIGDVDLVQNLITTGSGDRTVDVDSSTAGGVVLIGGANGGRTGEISGVRIIGNSIISPHAGIRIVGGWSPFYTETGDAPPQSNTLRCISVAMNTVSGTNTPLFARADLGAAISNSVAVTVDQLGSFAALLPDPVIDVDATNAARC